MVYASDTTLITAKALTHAGVFHADDVFATALLTLLRDDIKVIRSNVVPEKFDGIVYDIGGGEFDHHRGELRYRPNGVPYSSFGLLWKRFGGLLLDEDSALTLDEELVQPIDLTDNTGEPNPLTKCIQDFNPLIAASIESFDDCFWDAVDWARDILERRIRSLKYRQDCRAYVRERMSDCNGKILVLERMVPWKQEVIDSGYVFVIYPSLRGGFNVQGVPLREGNPELVKPFPEMWRGKDAATLRRLTGVEGITFCHPSGFLCAAETLEDAHTIARNALEEHMDYNVLALALSTLPYAIVKRDNSTQQLIGMRKTTYQLKDKKTGEFVGQTYEGLGQMEVTPLFITGHYGASLTHIIVLATKETLSPIDFDNDARKTCSKIVELYDADTGSTGRWLDMTESADDPSKLETISHFEFFQRRLRNEGITAVIESIEVDPSDPSEGLEKLQKRIRDLYSQCIKNRGQWKLWLDNHGGFRETSMAMFGLMQMLAAPDEQELASYTSKQNVIDIIKEMNDGRDTIPVEAVFGVEFEQASASRGKIQPIVDRTDFYSTFARPAIEAYMNYGQFAQMAFESNATDEQGITHPYAFISYRRIDAPKERYAFLGRFKKLGFRYWYDDDIKLKEDWEKRLYEANRDCTVFIALLTKGYMQSYRCLCELRQAFDEGKYILFISLDQTSLNEFGTKDVSECYHNDSSKEVLIYQEELAPYLAQQHLASRHITFDGVFQPEAFARRLLDLCDNDEKMSAIRS